MNTRYGLVIDLDRCTGCQTCVIACKMEHGLEGYSGIRVETVGGQYRDTPAGTYPDFSMYYLPIPCMHCAEAPCLSACPTDAIYRRRDGIVLIDVAKCDGCQMCLEACPYEVLVYNGQNNKVWKCNLCAHRIDQGVEPFCVLCCEPGAMFFGDITDPSSQVYQWAERREAYMLKPKEGTDPGVSYCPVRERRARTDSASAGVQPG